MRMINWRDPSYTAVWVWLLALLVVGVLFAYLPLGRPVAILMIFTAAVAKAFLVARHYMHLKSETLLVYAIAGIPVLLLVGLTLALVPDVVFNR